MGRMKTMPSTASTTPRAKDTYTKSEKFRFARSGSPSPKLLATSAEPPVPNMKPTVAITIRKGIIRLTAANGVLPA